MSKSAKVAGIVTAVVLLVGMWLMLNYNSMVTSRNKVERSQSALEASYQERFDLVDNLVSTVKGGQAQERDVFGQIADARTRYNNASSDSEKEAIASSINTVALLRPLQEAYPDLKSNQQVQVLMNKLANLEDGIKKSRNDYSDAANSYNTSIQVFPKSWLANQYGFTAKPLYKSEAGAQKAPNVNF